MAKKIAVTGTGRSGTSFFAAVLSELGKDVKHEEMGADGIASWCLVADVTTAVYGPGGAALNEHFIVGHQVRHPLKTIGSLTTFNKTSWRYICENSPALPHKILHRAMAHWLDWNSRAVDRASFTWKLEDIEGTVPEILDALGWGVSDEVWAAAYIKAKHSENSGATRSSDSLFNYRVGPITQWRRFKYKNRKSPLTWDELRTIDSGLTKEIEDFSNSLGYDI